MATTIAPVATISLPNPSRILRTSWCPDKDLLVILSRFAHQEKLSLWKMSGSKKWEIDLPGNTEHKIERIVDIAWSPDVQSIAVVSNPGLVTIHSIQNGAIERTIPIPGRRFRVTGIWWFAQEKKPTSNGTPEVFKRGDNITGSAHAILRNLPLLDPIQDETKPLTSNDLFAFHGSRTRAAQAPKVLPVITTWPSLPTDLVAASIASNKPDANKTFPEAEDEEDDTNVNSVLAVSDNMGNVHLFLEGSYPLGHVHIGACHAPHSLYKLREYLFAHPGPSSDLSSPAAPLRACVLRLSYLTGRHFRDVARVSSAARELVWYAMRVVREMRAAWFGSEANVGARELGPKWVNALEQRQRNEFGHDDPYALLDLTCLLTTGRSSEALMDYLGSAEHMSERSLQKWETTMTEALIRLRDSAEKRVAPACQRLRLLLQEAQGWAALPQYAVCNFKAQEIEACLDMTARAIVSSAWLAAIARKELLRFKEFMKWLRYEIARVNAADHHQPRPQHDILEVNEYLTSGLVASQIDKWFIGPAPRFTPESLGVPQNTNIGLALRKAHAALNLWHQTVHDDVKRRDLGHVERNIDALLQTLATSCQKIFDEASKATARSAVLLAGSVAAAPAAAEGQQDEGEPAPQPSGSAPRIRERTVLDDSQADSFLQYLAFMSPHETHAVDESGRSYLCVARLQQGLGELKSVPTVEATALECCVPVAGSEENAPVSVLDFDFFDDNMLVIVYRPKDQDGGATCVATVGYANLIYDTIPAQAYVTGTTRETLMDDVRERLASGQLLSAPAPIIQSRPLKGCREGGVTLAVNGRAGRRVSCVLDGRGTTTGSDDASTSRLSDAALRKKKNADAQAAFRARRANYIATLEETVTNLESVVLQLQEARRQTDRQLQDMRQENARLKTELEHKDSLLRMYQEQRKVDREPQDDYPMGPYPPVRTPPIPMSASMSAGPASHYTDDSMRYASTSNPAASMNGSSYHNPNAPDYSQRSPAMQYPSVPGNGSESRSMDPHGRMPRYDPYAPYPIDTSGRGDGSWVGHPGTAVSDQGSMDNSSATHSPTFVESPTLTATDLSYPSRYGVVDEQKVPLTPLSTSPYMFPPSRSLSPAASTPSSTSSTSLAPASYPFTFPEGTSLQERPEFYRRTQGPELTLHGGTADISSIVRMSSGRASVSTSASANGCDRPVVQAPSPYARTDNGSHERESDGESSSYTYSSRSRTRPVSRSSRSPSPGPPPICGTLAVIKAQAFGALRRTRGRSKKTSEGAAKAAVEALAARGIDVVANPAKRPRMHDSDGDLRI
ncbi:anaphase-promoting complex, cyclosome, subunit 4-domain-containing protein [Trametes punicea]|nr:anaphase-promoting complex, cyclosome, subunit 4-domain-containing protein [Trametes punicea]